MRGLMMVVAGILGATLSWHSGFLITDWQYWIFVLPTCFLMGVTLGWIGGHLQ
jgi:hypothetical protein